MWGFIISNILSCILIFVVTLAAGAPINSDVLHIAAPQFIQGIIGFWWKTDIAKWV